MDYADTADFMVFVDRAGHLIAEVKNGRSYKFAAIDFGNEHPATSTLLCWLGMDRREELAYAINVLLHTEFASR